MKENKKTQSVQTSISNKVSNSLFDSILARELQESNELECAKYANRVGLLCKVMLNRQLDALLSSFKDDVSKLVQEYSKTIDNELSKSEKD